jgi:diguanylate cyclase (GGDEF)-like protein
LREDPALRDSIRAVPTSPPPRDDAPTPDAPDRARVLVVDDEPVVRDFVARVLELAGHHVVQAGGGEEALALLDAGSVDVVLLDWMMPGLSGIDTCRAIKSRPVTDFVPVVLVTARADAASRVEGLRAGADDYLGKPFDRGELVARVGAMLRIKRRHDDVATRLAAESGVDELTGLYNARFLAGRVAEEFRRAERYHEPFACMHVDVDRLREHDDAGGRVGGDAVIRAVADALRRSVRDVDVVARVTGAEFVVLLPSTHFAGSITVAERLWRDVADSVGGPAGRVALSIGVALYPSRDVRTKDALLAAARAALAHAKHAGGNRISVFQQQGASYSPAIGAARRPGSLPPGPRSLSPHAGTAVVGDAPRSRP